MPSVSAATISTGKLGTGARSAVIVKNIERFIG